METRNKMSAEEMMKLYEECSDFKNFMRIRAMARPDVPVFHIYGKNSEAPERIIMFEDFKNEIDALGTWFYCNGYRNRHIAVLGENSYEGVLTMFAAVYGGSVALLLDTTKSAEELCEVVRDCDAEVIVYSPSFAKTAMSIKMQTGLPLIPMENLAEKIEGGRRILDQGFREFVDHVTDGEAISVICCTSGTSGRSKGVMISQRSIVKIAVKAMEKIFYPDYGKTFFLLPMYHIYSLVHNVFMAIALGGTICFTGGFRTLAADYVHIQPEMMFLVPRLVEMLSVILKKFPEVNAPGYLFCGGAAPELNLMRDFADRNVTVAYGYGLTESAACACLSKDCFKYPDGSMEFLDGVGFKLVDVDENGVGELLISGPGIMIGYYKMPEETERKLDKEGFLHTGDLAYLTEEDRVVIKGRKDRMMILSNGLNVSPEEIEADLAAIDGVAEVFVCLDHGVITARIFTEEPEKKESIQKAVNEVNANCSAYRQTEKVIFMDEPMPKTGAGKIKYNQLMHE